MGIFRAMVRVVLRCPFITESRLAGRGPCAYQAEGDLRNVCAVASRWIRVARPNGVIDNFTSNSGRAPASDASRAARSKRSSEVQ